MSKKIRDIVFNKCGGRCAYCGHALEDKWQVDHAISKQYWFYIDSEDPKKVNDISNLMPSCVICNHYKRSLCVDGHHTHTGFRKYMLTFHTRLAKLPKKTLSPQTAKRKGYMQRIADRYGITTEKPFSGVFYFETIDKIKAA